ncbi:MAG: hypothetical protein M1500_01020 [Candidatus Marsarchaeota archaeon]|nr:hypothetical protein [Candidatus Marsarchaeota archaeon]MCL5112283.1 hypothetical protein [Candidatus Marsarchaeota archaeon]
MYSIMRRQARGQSSLELLITLSFGLIILLPIVVFAFIQISTASSTLSSTNAQAAASKLASVAAAVGTQGYPAKQLVLINVPTGVQNIYVGTQSNGVGHEIVFTVSTSAGLSSVIAYTPVNVSGYLDSITQTGSYLVNVSAQNSCPSNPIVSCVYIKPT